MTGAEEKARWAWLPVVLVSLGVLLVWGCAFANRGSLGPWQYGFYLGGLFALASVFWFRWRLSSGELELEAIRAEIDAKQRQLKRQQRDFQRVQKQAESELRRQATRIDRREEELARKLIALHELQEFPQTIDVAERSVSEDQLSELAEKDRRMLEMLEEESKKLFEKIRTNEYSGEGAFQPTLLRDDAYSLMARVAQIYKPDARQPLLETSIAQVLHSCSRASLHFLAVLDNLPLDVKEYNVNNMYGYVQKAVKAYGAYKTAAPYFPYINAAYRAGRVAMGANPVSVGAWWLGVELGKHGATKLVQRFIDRQAIVFLHDLVRVIGFEVANIYGGDFRHRDANWIYAAELTELIGRFPLTRESLSHGLKEVSAIRLRSEYDRVYLYRLLAEHRSAQPDRFRAKAFLTGNERQEIAARLERFLDAFIHPESDKQAERWQRDLEERLCVKVKLARDTSAQPIQQQTEDAIRSLAGFLVEMKHCDPAEVLSLLKETKIVTGLSDEVQQAVMKSIEASPPFFFEHPNIEPGKELASLYLAELIELAVSRPPYDPATDESIVDCAAYLREEENAVRKTLDQQYIAHLTARFPPNASPRPTSPTVARAALNLLETDQPRLLYGGVVVDRPRAARHAPDANWLLGTDDQLVLFSVADDMELLWRGDSQVSIQREGGLLHAKCRLKGGQWLKEEEAEEAELLLPGPMVGSYERFFEPLISFCQTETATAPIID